LQFAVATKLKNLEVQVYEVEAEGQQIERTKGGVERVWEGSESRIFYPTPSAMQCPTCAYRAECRAWRG
jgi:hypothetical protein